MEYVTARLLSFEARNDEYAKLGRAGLHRLEKTGAQRVAVPIKRKFANRVRDRTAIDGRAVIIIDME